MQLEVAVPSAQLQAAKPGRNPHKAAHAVFKVDVICNGRKHTLEKRYSEFHALHKRIKKICKVPNFPPKRVPYWMAKVMERRRQHLEAYLQGILLHNRKLPRDLLDFLKLWHFPQDGKASPIGPSLLLSHQPVINYCSDPYMLPSSTDLLSNAILSGVLQGIYAPQTDFILESKILARPSLGLPKVSPLPRHHLRSPGMFVGNKPNPTNRIPSGRRDGRRTHFGLLHLNLKG